MVSTSNPVMTGAAVAIEALRREGVKHVFGLPGTTIMHLIDALAQQDAIRFISVRHEQVAAYMADGFARGSGHLGVCMASRGPGAANMAIGIHNAFAESVPVLALIGQVGDDIAHREAFEEMDLVAFFRPITKWAVELHVPMRISELLQRAVRTALGGRPRPVMVSIPLDVQTAAVGGPVFMPTFRHHHPVPSATDVDRAAALLARAERPVVVLGGGALRRDGRDGLVRLAEMLAAPVVTSWLRKNAFPNSHRLFIGSLGYGACPVTEETVQHADVLLALGFRFSEFSTRHWQLVGPDTRLIQADIDPEELGRTYVPAVGLQGDAHATAAALGQALAERRFDRGPRRERAEQLRRRYDSETQLPGDDGKKGVGSAALIEALREALARHRLVLIQDVHTFGPWIQRFLSFDVPGTYYGAAGGSMGWGFGAALGLQLARPDERMVCVSGDGSFWMVAQDLETAVRERIPVVTIVVNNFSYGNTRDRQRLDHGGRYLGVFYNNPDFAAFARLLGAHGERVERPEELTPALDRALASGLPAVVDVIQDRYEGLPPGVVPPRIQ